MSVTFQIEGFDHREQYEAPCETCGISIMDSHQARASGDPRWSMDCTCMGYGGPSNQPASPYEFNVACGNVATVLGLCGDPGADEYLEPDAVLAALATADPSDHVLDSRDEGRVHHGGRSREQVARYIETMRRIATKARKYGRRIVLA